jgi:hypothetical protein
MSLQAIDASKGAVIPGRPARKPERRRRDA